MNALIDWYFEKCRISVILMTAAVVWVVAACLMLGEAAPAVYVALHAATTGVFTCAILRVRQHNDAPRQTAEPLQTAVPVEPAGVQKQSA